MLGYLNNFNEKEILGGISRVQNGLSLKGLAMKYLLGPGPNQSGFFTNPNKSRIHFSFDTLRAYRFSFANSVASEEED